MAKTSIIQRELKREKLVARYARKRAEIKATIQNVDSTDEQRWQAQISLQKLPKNSAPTRVKRRCRLTGRPHGVYRKFGLSRNMLRKLTMLGDVPGLKKASW